MINLHIEPRSVLKWREFIKNNPNGYAIGLDGYIRGKPRFEKKGPYANFNHHEGVDRLSTRSTCAQVYIAIKQGLFDSFRKDREPHSNVFVNDADQDVCLSWWLLSNHERIEGQRSEPLLTKLVNVTDLLDATAGSYPLDPETTIRRELTWIYQPYIEARMDGRIPQMKEAEMRNTIEAVCQRINDYTLGRGKKITPDTRYEKIGGGDGWTLIREIGFDARSDLLADGVKAFVSVSDNGCPGTFRYSIGRISTYVPFPVPEIYDYFNKIEKLDPNSGNCWSGGVTIGGSPLVTGSIQSPKELEKNLNEFLNSRKA